MKINNTSEFEILALVVFCTAHTHPLLLHENTNTYNVHGAFFPFLASYRVHLNINALL